MDSRRKMGHLEDIERNPGCRLLVQQWRQTVENCERNIKYDLQMSSKSDSDLYEFLGVFFVFQGVIISVAAQSTRPQCNQWPIFLALSLMATFTAMVACMHKLKGKDLYLKNVNLSTRISDALKGSLETLEENGPDNITDPQMTGYMEPDIQGNGRFHIWCSFIYDLFRTWVLSYRGVVLLVLLAFGAVTMFAVQQILCQVVLDDSTQRCNL